MASSTRTPSYAEARRQTLISASGLASEDDATVLGKWKAFEQDLVLANYENQRSSATSKNYGATSP